VKTQQEYKELFNEALEQQNPTTNPALSGGDWDFYGTAVGAVAASASQDIQSLRLALFVQFAQGVFLDYALFSLGLPARSAETFAVAQASNSVLPGSPYFFPKDTPFTSSFNGSTYLLISDVTMSTTEPTVFSLQSQESGPGFQLPEAAVLSNTVQPTVSIAVSMSTDGQSAETDGQVRQRILQAKQNPPGSGRAEDYILWASQASSFITNPYAVIIPDFFPGSSQVGVYVTSGGADYDSILVNTLPYTRTATAATITAADIYIRRQKPVQSRVFVSSVSTYMITNAIVINVVLPDGFTLSSLVTNIDGNPITIEDMVFQEFRRGFITYPFTGTLIGSTPYILLSRLQQTLDVGLSVNGGIYQQILVSREILVDGLAQDIVVPYNQLDSNLNLECVYDIDQSQVTINQV
jgi:hypothetical protein